MTNSELRKLHIFIVKWIRDEQNKRFQFWILLIFIAACTSPSGQQADDWPMYSADATGSKYSSLAQINRSNVDQLEVAWIYRAGDMTANSKTDIQCNPIIIKGRMYLITPGLKVVALEADTGKEIWKFDPFQGLKASGTNRGLTYYFDGKKAHILHVSNFYLYRLDALTGRPDSSFGSGGKVDLSKGLGRDIGGLWVTATSPGIVYKNSYILGSRVMEGPGPAAPGHIRAYDLMTGEMKWIFHTIPYPGEFGYDTWPTDAYKTSGGANSWGGFTLDEGRGIVFCGTGSASYDHWGGDREGDNLFANCILALDAETGERRWHFQAVHHDIWDYDLPCPPNLVQVKRGDILIDAVAQPTKMGHLFVLDRETGKPIYPITEEPVPQSTIPGEMSSPTQPFPPVSLRYGHQRFSEDEVTNLSAAAATSVRERLKDMVSGDIFIPPGQTPTITLPQFNGGTDWGGASYDPESRMLYVNCSNEAEWISMVPTAVDEGIYEYDLGRKMFQAQCESCHGNQNALQTLSPGINTLKKLGKDTARMHIGKILSKGKGQMPAFTALTNTESSAIASFILEEGKEKFITPEQLNTANIQKIPWIATGHVPIKTPDGFPINKRPWGTLNAINLDTGRIEWQVPLGTYPALEAQGYPSTGTFNMGGSIVTAGGLIFIGAAMDERLHAYDKFSGELLWEFQMDAGGYATPSTYLIDGKQYLVMAAGGGGKPGTKSGDAYYCFKLPD